MPGRERSRRPGPDDEDLTGLLNELSGPVEWSEADAQDAMTRAAQRLGREMIDADAKAWEGSEYAWMRSLAAAAKGKAAERLVASFLAGQDLVVSSARGSGYSFALTAPGTDQSTIGEADIVTVDAPRRASSSLRVKVRLSLRWATGDFVFQQLEHGEYDKLVLLGVEPARVCAWVVSAGEVHGKVDASTGWLSFPAGSPPAWLAGCGPDLAGLRSRLTT